MADQIYTKLMEKFAKRGGVYPGMDIPEFYEMASELFSPEEASVAVAIPKGFSTAEQVAQDPGQEQGGGRAHSTYDGEQRALRVRQAE